MKDPNRNVETVEDAERFMNVNKLWKSKQPKDTPVQEMVARGRLVADRSLEDDLSEKKTEAIGLEGVHFELRNRLDAISAQIESLEAERLKKDGLLSDNKIRLISVKNNIHDLELALLGG